MYEIAVEFTSLTSKEFKTEKTEEVSAAKIPNTIPCQYVISTEKIMQIAPIIINPIKISYQITFRFSIIGSAIAVNKVPVEKAAIVTDTLDTFIAP